MRACPIERLVGHRAEPTALAAWRAKLDAAIASQQDSPYVLARTAFVRISKWRFLT
jgi:putative cardiolipin synthase